MKIVGREPSSNLHIEHEVPEKCVQTRSSLGYPPPPPSPAVAGFGGYNPPRQRRMVSLAEVRHIYYNESMSSQFWYVYVLMCSDKKPYIGCTENLKERINRHKKGHVPATKPRLPIKLISYFAFPNKFVAFNFEKYLKSGSGRAFMKKHLLS